MKANIKKLLTVLGVSITLFTGCETYDDSELTARVDDLENRVQTLEERIEEFQNSVDEFTELINQFKNDVRITDFAETSDGYLINLSVLRNRISAFPLIIFLRKANLFDVIISVGYPTASGFPPPKAPSVRKSD